MKTLHCSYYDVLDLPAHVYDVIVDELNKAHET